MNSPLGTRRPGFIARESLSFARSLLRNLAQGVRLGIGGSRPHFHSSSGQLLALLAIGWMLAFFADWREIDEPISVSSWGIAAEAARNYWWLAALAVINLLNRGPGGFLRLAVPCAAADPLVWISWLGLSAALPTLQGIIGSPLHDELWWGIFVWQVLIVARSLALSFGRFRKRTFVLAGLYAVFLYVSNERLPDEALLYADRPAASGLDVEATYYQQARLLDRELDSVVASRPGAPDFYFLGFSAYAAEGVFRREVSAVRRIVGQTYDAIGRSVLLVNSLRTVNRLPVANRSNLEYVLHHLGAKMETAEDILFLFITSHGSADGHLAVEFSNLGFNDLTPSELRRMLDEAGIKWRVLVISSCYSGAFLPALQTPETMVITASASDRSSFGCAHENRWTYFGEAFFRDTLAKEDNLERAFELARERIEKRELEEGKEPSHPQIAVGVEIRRQLARWAQLR